jgi:fructose-1-phosphate kinase PfkB-like protein
VKLNAAEAASWSGQDVETPAQALVAAGRLVEAGARMAVVTLGKQGAVMMAGKQAWLAEAPSVSGNGSVGSGDAMLAGLALGLARQAAAEDALRLGMAAGAANMMHLGAGQVRRHDVDRLLPRVKLSQPAG